MIKCEHMSIFARLTGFVRKHKIVTALLCIVLAFTLFFTVKGWIETPTDLGPKLEYIGKEDFGCAPFPLVFVCPGPFYSAYYFATNMSEEELAGYFTKAKLNELSRGGGGVDYAADDIYLKVNFQTNRNPYFHFYFYYKIQAVLANSRLKSTGKLHIVSITNSDYKLAKESL